MSWLARLAMRLYPAWWRRRYGPELQALMEDTGPTWRTVLDVGKEGLVMQLRDFRSPLYLVIGCALLGAGVGAAVFAATPPRWAFASSIEVQSPSESPETRLRALASGAFSDDNLGRVVERFGLYRGGQNGQALADAHHQFRSDIALALTPAGFQISFSYPDEDKARRVVDHLSGLLIDANLRVSGSERYLIKGPPRQSSARPGVMKITSVGMGAGLLVGILVAVWRRRRTPVSQS